MATYLIGNQQYPDQSPDLDAALQRAYETKDRPMCDCRQGGVAMYIAKLSDNHYVIKRMPNTGHLHDSDCNSFEMPPELSGRGAIDQKAIIEDESTGLTTLKLDFALSKTTTTRMMAEGTGATPISVEAEPSKLSIRSLLHYLYEDAGLNRWSPKMEGKRNWFVMRKYLLGAADNKVARKTAISASLFIPEPFRSEEKDILETRQKAFMAQFRPDGKKLPMGLLIGEVKSFAKARFGYKMMIKHMPTMPFFMDEKTYTRIVKVFRRELSVLMEKDDCHVLCVCSFTVSPSGNPLVENFSMMTTNKDWLPFDTPEDYELTERLQKHQHHFIKSLRYNLQPNEVMASVLITRANEDPIAVYTMPLGADGDDYAELEALIGDGTMESRLYDLNDVKSLSQFDGGIRDYQPNWQAVPSHSEEEQAAADEVDNKLDLAQDNVIPQDIADALANPVDNDADDTSFDDDDGYDDGGPADNYVDDENDASAGESNITTDDKLF